MIFDELRYYLETEHGFYVDGIVLRKVLADLIREHIVCKTPSPERKKFLLLLCKEMNCELGLRSLSKAKV